MGCGASVVKLKPETMVKIGALYCAIKGDDPDLEKGISRQDAKKFFKGKFGKLSADAMFNEVDTDHSDDITQKEFLEFWTQVRRNGYKEEDLVDEIDAMIGMHLFRGRVERFVDDFAENLETSDATIAAKSNAQLVPTRVSRLHDPINADRSLQQAQNLDDCSDSNAAQRILTPMLMHTVSWVPEEWSAEAARELADLTDTSQTKQASRIKPDFTAWGSAPEPQDFERLMKGCYAFRGERVLQMRVSQGEVVVKEFKQDDDYDDVDASEHISNVDNLRAVKDEEALQRELNFAWDGIDEKQIKLETFLSRQ